MNGSPDAIAGLNDLPVRTQQRHDHVSARRGATCATASRRRPTSCARTARAACCCRCSRTAARRRSTSSSNLRAMLPRVAATLPRDVTITPLFDQSVFVKAAVQGRRRAKPLIAAVLTAAMVLLFLGNWRTTLIIALTIPLSILASILALQMLGETLNLMTLGGLALSVGILVDQAIVTIENIERHLHLGTDLDDGDPGRRRRDRRAGVRVDAVHLHRVRADVLPVRRGALSVRAAGRSGGVRDDRVVHPVAHAGAHAGDAADGRMHAPSPARGPSLLQRVYRALRRRIRARARARTRWLSRRACSPAQASSRRCSSRSACCRVCSIRCSGATSFRASTPARSGCTCARRPARASRRPRGSPTKSRSRSARSCRPISSTRSSTTSACPTAASTFPTATPAPSARSTARSCCRYAKATGRRDEFVAKLRAELPKRFPGVEFFFQPADIVTQILNFGLPAAIDVQFTGARPRRERGAGAASSSSRSA